MFGRRRMFDRKVVDAGSRSALSNSWGRAAMLICEEPGKDSRERAALDGGYGVSSVRFAGSRGMRREDEGPVANMKRWERGAGYREEHGVFVRS